MDVADDPRVERLGVVLERLADHPDPEVRAAVADLVDGIRWLHAEGLQRLTGLLAEEPDRFRRALDDPQISNLLLLYDLVVVDERERAQEALESMRPYMREHGGEVELLGVTEGVVRLRLLGSCHGCPSSTATLRQGIERTLAERLPGFHGLEVEGEGLPNVGSAARDRRDARIGKARSAEPVSFVPLERLLELEKRVAEARGGEERSPAPAQEAELGPLDALPSGVLHGLLHDNYPILLLRTGGNVRAYQNTCPGTLLPLHLGTLEDGVVTCPWHGCRFDVATGRRQAAEGPPLHPLDVCVEGGQVRVRIE
jgi:Fe-S cluster biogenesis protein NfuA/nitrite reductase/ring-hydroxylating ferredoxin subunit